MNKPMTMTATINRAVMAAGRRFFGVACNIIRNPILRITFEGDQTKSPVRCLVNAKCPEHQAASTGVLSHNLGRLGSAPGSSKRPWESPLSYDATSGSSGIFGRISEPIAAGQRRDVAEWAGQSPYSVTTPIPEDCTSG
ncbi:hypothetical protein [Ensifer sp. M14]|uniref:hypothetical protein n=1 Tax=Ensifer sp. M14 TaxID=2203782 RepID=UPI0011C01E80|nr:hypothetical protein [Ensifer sp. M14]